VILYGSQSSAPTGDYLSLNLVDGVLQLRYDLGSGSANIVSVLLLIYVMRINVLVIR